jgi:hydrogenase-4 component E
VSPAATSVIELAASLVLLGAVVTLWRRSLAAAVKTLLLQGVALGAVAFTLGLAHHDGGLIAVAVLVLAAKALVIPALVARALAADPAARESAPLVNVPASLVSASALAVLAYLAGRPVSALVGTRVGDMIPLGLATALVGFFVMVVRRRAVSQIVGLVLVDNGIALVAFLATAGVPLIVELGSSLDVLLGVVVLRVLVAGLRSAGVEDLDQLRELRD